MTITPKILFTDIDGTLLNKQRRLSADNIDAVRRLYQEQSIPVILVSARMPSSLKLLQQELGINTHRICYNGALILGHDSEEILSDEKLSEADCREIIAQANEHGLHASVYLYNNWYAGRRDEWSDKEILVTRIKPTTYDITSSYTPDRGAHKIMIMGDASKIDQIENHMQRHHLGRINFYRTKPTYIELSAEKANKLTGIKKVLQYYNLQLKDAITLGDSHNDREMIKAAGIGVAVGNAPKEVLEAADFIAPPGIEDGVSFAIRHFFG